MLAFTRFVLCFPVKNITYTSTVRSTDRVVDTQLCKLSVTSAARVLQHAVQISFFGVQICFIPTVLTFPSRAVLYSREYHLFEVWSDWLTVRGRIALTGLGLGLGLGLVLFLPYTVCVNRFLE